MSFRRRLIPVVATAIAAGAAVAVLGTSQVTGTSGKVVLTSGVSDAASSSSGPVMVSGQPGVSPAAGVHWKNFCGAYWKNVMVGGVGYNIYNDDFGATTCLQNTGNAGFTISKSTVAHWYKAYPNISEGWEWGKSPLHGFKFPVKFKNDGHPKTSVSVSLRNKGTWNAAYDMWFSKTAQTDGQDNGAEVMVWLNCRNNCLTGKIVTIEGVRFYKRSWTSHLHGVSWHYVAFVAVRKRTSFKNLWLNQFYKAAGVNPNWYLTSIDFGFELVDNGWGLRVNNYSLTGVN